MREIWGFLRPVSRLANPFGGHPSEVRTQTLVLQTCVDLRVRLACAERPFVQCNGGWGKMAAKATTLLV